MSLNKGMFTSNKSDWETPKGFFDNLDGLFHFTLDACALPENAKCEKFFSPEEDGLAQPWDGVVWCNPPYGRQIGDWVKKGYEESNRGGACVVMLLPARTDTAWFHNYCMKGEIFFVRGRLKFGDSENSAPFPSMIVVFGKRRFGAIGKEEE